MYVYVESPCTCMSMFVCAWERLYEGGQLPFACLPRISIQDLKRQLWEGGMRLRGQSSCGMAWRCICMCM